jgi:hypothetical protein
LALRLQGNQRVSIAAGLQDPLDVHHTSTRRAKRQTSSLFPSPDQ